MRDIAVWQGANTQKYLRDKRYEKADATEFQLKLYQNETEGVQLLITPDVDVKSFDVTVSALKNGAMEIPKKDVTVYVEKYIELTKRSYETHLELGWYPDALLEMPVAKKFGENKISAKCNQGVWINVKTHTDTVAGEYKGVITVLLDGETMEYPFAVTVWDFALPTENHTKQYFIISKKQMQLGEGEKSLERVERYFEKALDYRINGSNLPFNHRTDTFEEAFENFLVAMKKYYADPRCSYYDICFFINKTWDDLNYERVEYVFHGIAKECLKDGINYFKKALTYIWILDEPNLAPERVLYCKKVLPEYALTRKRIAKQYENSGELGKEIAETIVNLPNVITAGVMGEILPEQYDAYSIEWCPPFNTFDFQENKVVWKTVNSKEKWWYGCNWPNPPYPTYHIDDTLLSPRLLSWMQFNLGITGNLYWRFNYCAVSEKRGGVPNPYVLADPCEGTNGEGFLAYPGKPYGLDSFVPSIRLEAIRDGIEDYEALYSLQSLWEKNAERFGETPASVNEVLSPIYTRLFDNVRLLEKPIIPFSKARETVASLLIVSKKYGFFVKAIDEKNKTITFCSAGEISCDGGTVSKQGDDFVLTVTGERASVTVSGEKVTLYAQSKAYPIVYSLEFNWKKTAEKYKIGADAPTVLQPYYEKIRDKQESYKNSVTDLQKLLGFVWRTEVVIQKQEKGEETEVKFVLPKGDLKLDAPFEMQPIDESAKIYTVKTKACQIAMEAETDKGVYKAVLYLKRSEK